MGSRCARLGGPYPVSRESLLQGSLERRPRQGTRYDTRGGGIANVLMYDTHVFFHDPAHREAPPPTMCSRGPAAHMAATCFWGCGCRGRLQPLAGQPLTLLLHCIPRPFLLVLLSFLSTRENHTRDPHPLYFMHPPTYLSMDLFIRPSVHLHPASICPCIRPSLHPTSHARTPLNYCEHMLHKRELISVSVQSVQSLSRVRLCDSTGCSTPAFPVHHQLLELIQIHVH